MAAMRCTLFFLVVFFLESSTSDVLLPVTRTTQPDKKVDTPDISQTQLDRAFLKAEEDAARRIEIEDNLPPSGFVQATSHSVEARHQRFLAFKNRTSELDQNADMFDSASRYLVQALGLSKDQATFGLKHVVLPSRTSAGSVRAQCRAMQSNDPCDPDSKYRTLDGSCNNLQNPTWGKALTCMGRLLPPDYADGISSPRQPVPNQPLPNPRKVSVQVHEALTSTDGNFTHMVMGFGQFLNHDITMGLMTRTVRNHTMLSCCPYGESNHPECSMGIQIPHHKEDFFIQHNQTCINFVRSATCSQDCALGPRQHSNQITNYMDASNVYGSFDDDSLLLRTTQDGLLKSQFFNGEEFPPSNGFPDTDQCTIAKENKRCFAAGDKRVNEQPMLSSMHTIWLRHHNNLARGLKELNPTFSDEELFQRARRILIAQYQNIIMKEYMPTLVGPAYMDFFELNIGKASNYDPTMECALFNEFMTAANRFGHTLIQKTIEEGPGSNKSMNLADVYVSPFVLYQEGLLDPVLSGLAHQAAKAFNPHLVTAVTHDVYKQKHLDFGMDLASLNVQRGRDQGTAGYVQYLEHCFNWTVTSFKQLEKIMSKSNWQNLEKVYEGTLENVDLFTGGVSETPLDGAVVGPTFGCVMGIQFYRFKYGDRFYYEHKDQAGSFSEEQLHEIRRTTFSQIICQNSNSIKNIAENVFILTNNKTNPYTDCGSFPELDLKLFLS